MGFISVLSSSADHLLYAYLLEQQVKQRSQCIGYYTKSSRHTDVCISHAGVSVFIFHNAKGKLLKENRLLTFFYLLHKIKPTQAEALREDIMPPQFSWPSRQAGKSFEISKLNPLKIDLTSGGYQIIFPI